MPARLPVAYGPDSCFLDDRAPRPGTVVWSFRVSTTDPEIRALEIDVWNPRVEPDRTDDGRLFYDWTFDRLTHRGTDRELSDEECDDYTSAVLDLLRDSET